ncbi:single-stranded-DNA-specific exonuclease RecJ [Aquisediminimonas sediminicola]|uniref:single-stranded-DNA-specific exonuclease RecJ n=1 Tax=Alteraquisediminimonas sediminicola TaxID=2676787 RepID=UPI001C8D3D20|nr:single-stranded-DNA-specific exonuclease RecJ [Aquisediminimonas sediminicola]
MRPKIQSIPTSMTGQAWHWRYLANDGTPDQLLDSLLLGRGVPPYDLDRHRHPTIRDFMPDPSLFQDMETAAKRLADAVERNERVVIFGDYDVDGATSAAVLIRLLRALGNQAGYYIPDRLLEGYGPSGKALVELGQQGAQLVVTVDCGAQAFEALGMAKAAGLDVMVVDHHQCVAALPEALALVNPNRLDEHPEAALHGHLAAVGVAFLLAAALVRELRGRGRFASQPEPSILPLLDIVALGTVADVAALKGLNRAFVAQGLKVMANRRNIGLNALLSAARLERAPQCSDLGFALGPRINAGGRVGKSDLGVRLLITEDEDEAREISAELNRLNEERRAIEAQVQEQAEAACVSQANMPVIVATGQGWHPGVIGIVAGRLKEKFNRPAIVIAIDEDGIGKGSGRSITGVDLGAAVLAARDHGLLVGGGGHAMAAGLTINADQVDGLTHFLNDRLAGDVAAASLDRMLLVDTITAPRGINPGLAEQLEAAGPFGMGWPAPRIVTGPVRIVKADIVGQNHLRMIVSGDDGGSFKAMGFRLADQELGQILLALPRDRRLWLAGRIKKDDWGSRPAAEMHIDDAAFAD